MALPQSVLDKIHRDTEERRASYQQKVAAWEEQQAARQAERIAAAPAEPRNDAQGTGAGQTLMERATSGTPLENGSRRTSASKPAPHFLREDFIDRQLNQKEEAKQTQKSVREYLGLSTPKGSAPEGAPSVRELLEQGRQERAEQVKQYEAGGPRPQSIGGTIRDVAGRGAGWFLGGATTTADFLANLLPRVEGAIMGVEPEGTLTGQMLKPVTDATGKLNDWVHDTTNTLDEQVDYDTKDSKVARLAADLGSSTVAALPNTILAVLSGGASASAEIGTQATGLVGTARTAVSKMAQNPMYWTSVAQTIGPNYDNAIASGATESEAILSAVISSAFNAAVEVGGGVETLPSEIRNVDLSTPQKAWAWMKSALEEGGEEFVQGILERLTNKAVFDEEKPYFSMTDEDAVFNPYVSAQEAGMGTAVGGILGGGQVFADTVMNRSAKWNEERLNAAIQDTFSQLMGGEAQNNQKLNIDNTESQAYNKINENGGAFDGRNNQLDGAPGEGVRTGRGGSRADSGIQNGGSQDGQGNLSDSGIVLLSPEAQQTLSERGIVNVELHDSSMDNTAFSAALDAARAADSKNGWAVTPKDANALTEAGTRTFLDRNGSTGFAIAKDGDIEAVFANKTAGAPKGATKSTMPQAIANGGNKLDCYGTDLVRIYSKYGFIPVARVTFNPEYANPGWTADKGTPDIYFMMHNGDSADSVVQNMSKYKSWSKAELDALPLMEYDEAYRYRDSLMQGRENGHKNTGAGQLTDVSENTPVFTSENGFAQTPANSNVAQMVQNINGNQGQDVLERIATAPGGPRNDMRGFGTGAEGGRPMAAPTESLVEYPGGGSVGGAQSGFDPYSHAANTYGTIEPGENPARVVDVPKSMDGESNVMQTVRTILEAGVTTDDAVPALEQEIVKGSFSAMPITDAAAAGRAEATIQQKGYEQALADWRADMRNGKVSKDNVALGETLYNAAVSAGDTKSAVKIAVDLAASVRSAAQALQAVRMLKQMSPAAQLYGVKQSVDSLQEQLKSQYGDRAPDLTIDEDLAAAFLAADTDEARQAAEEALYKHVAEQIPATFADKWNAWRYLSMLGNPRTHVRNILGNAMFSPVRWGKNQMGAVMETVAEKAGWIDKSQRTKSFGFNWTQADRARLAAANADYANAEELILSGGKYNSATSTIEQNRQIFKTAPLEALRKGNSKALDVEDSWFSKPAYASSLAGYLKAQGFTAEDFTGTGMTDAQKDKARSYAIQEAQKATYRDVNAFSDMISSIGFKNANSWWKKGVNTLIESVMPFKRTPANILARGMEYSPAGLVSTLTRKGLNVAGGGLSQSNVPFIEKLGASLQRMTSTNGTQYEATQFMDDLASGLTGTGLFALGYLLSNLGLLTGGSPEDEDQADLEGRQPYSLEIGGTSVTLDWLAPEALPVFMGVELSEAIRESAGKTFTMDSFKSFFNGLTGPVLEMSMMSSLQDALEATTYADNKIMAFLSNAALGYVGQAFPTLFGQLERMVSGKIRETTFTQKGGFLDTDTQYALGTIGNKIPFWDFSQVPYIDAWGRTEETGNVGTRAFNNLLNPAYVSKINETPVDREIKRLEQATGVNLTPSRAEKKLTVDKETILLTVDEYMTYATAKGQNDYTMRENLLNSEAYQGLDDDVKVKAMEYARSYADELARQEAGIQDVQTSWMQELAEADADTVTQALVAKAVESVLPATSAGKYTALADMVENDKIDDVIALSLCSETLQDAYYNGPSAAGITVQQWIDTYGYAVSHAEDNSTESKRAAVVEYANSLPISKEQRTALVNGMYSAMPDIILKDAEAPNDFLLEQGQAGIETIEANMSDSQKGYYETYIKGQNVDMETYLDVWEFKVSARSDYDKDGKTTKSAQEKVIEYIDKVGRTTQEKRKFFLAMGYSEKNLPDQWK